jgi:hypothetical protein
MDELISQIAHHLGLVGLFGFLTVIAILSTLKDLARIKLDIVRQRSNDLLKRRFAAYGRLWSQMATFAVFSAESFDAAAAQSSSAKLSEWYFSRAGGLLLSTTAREFYFALQETLTTFSRAGTLNGAKHVDGREAFCALLKSNKAVAAKYRACVRSYLNGHPEKMRAKDWKLLCRALTATVLTDLAECPAHGSDLAFCMVQQVSSTLRSRLAHEVQSRLDSTPKWWRI